MYKTEVVVANIIFLNKKSDFEEAGIVDEIDIEDDDKF